MNQSVSQSINDSVFIEQARIGENLAVNENVSFEDEFRQLLDKH